MYDLNNPSPFVLTHFECIATVSGFFAVALAIVLDLWRAGARRHRPTPADDGRRPS
jgi:hypothetical protein